MFLLVLRKQKKNKNEKQIYREIYTNDMDEVKKTP